MQQHMTRFGMIEVGPGIGMNRIRVLIIEEHVAVRRALAARLSACANIEVIGTAGNWHEGLERARDLRPDVVLLELKGADNAQHDPVGEMYAAMAGYPVGVIVLTTYADDKERETAIQAGASRYLLKHIDSAQLTAEIESVYAELSA